MPAFRAQGLECRPWSTVHLKARGRARARLPVLIRVASMMKDTRQARHLLPGLDEEQVGGVLKRLGVRLPFEDLVECVHPAPVTQEIKDLLFRCPPWT